MRVARTIEEMREVSRIWMREGQRVGLVPTMGALHAGHLSLIHAARRGCTKVVVSIFVNPTQFGPNEDLAAYPRDELADTKRCRAAGAHAVLLPEVDEIYAPDAATRVSVDGLTESLCGPQRPGHFEGVATIVAKLFNIVRPDAAYFGMKDYQQLAVIRRMAQDLNFPTEVIGCATVREHDGLAMSSRNAYLSPAERKRARALYRALRHAMMRIGDGQRETEPLLFEMQRMIEDEATPDAIDYISIVDAETLAEVGEIPTSDARPLVAALAVRIGQARLIDNVRIDPPAARP